jgi:DNA-binding transcriptional MerR regulator
MSADTAQGITIEDAAARTGLSRHTLRYYERIGLLGPVARSESGHRRYTEEDLGWIEFLTLLRETGMPIRDMHRFVELTRAGDATIAERVGLLRGHRDELIAQLDLLRRHLRAIERKIGVYTEMLAESQSRSPATRAKAS